MVSKLCGLLITLLLIQSTAYAQETMLLTARTISAAIILDDSAGTPAVTQKQAEAICNEMSVECKRDLQIELVVQYIPLSNFHVETNFSQPPVYRGYLMYKLQKNIQLGILLTNQSKTIVEYNNTKTVVAFGCIPECGFIEIYDFNANNARICEHTLTKTTIAQAALRQGLGFIFGSEFSQDQASCMYNGLNTSEGLWAPADKAAIETNLPKKDWYIHTR